MNKTALIIFVKNPIEGKVKTRLAKTIGNPKAVAIYKRLLAHTQAILQGCNAYKFVYYGDYINQEDLWDNDTYTKRLQHGEDLGQRMEHAFDELFNEGYDKVLIIGSDCAELTSGIVDDAIDALSDSDVTIGPTFDGGYYLLGMKKLHPDLFRNITWSTAEVFSQTLNIINKLGLNHTALQQLNDVDEEKDLPTGWL